MADLTRVSVPVVASELLIVGKGGAVKVREEWADGKRTGKTLQRNGSDLHRAGAGALSVSVAGAGLENAVLDTLTPLESIAAGTIFRAEGETMMVVAAEGRAGFGDGGPRGVLKFEIFVERLVPVGSLDDLLKQATAGTKSAAAAAGSAPAKAGA